MADVKVDYSDDLRKFTIRLPFHLNDHVAGMPIRRYSKRRGEWLAPATKGNAKYIRGVLNGKVTLTDRAEQEIERILSGAVQRGPEFPPHYPFKTEPMPHQLDALGKLYPLSNGAMFMEMGTGKTKVAIDYAGAHFIENQIRRVLVICPLSIRMNWQEQLLLHCPEQFRPTTHLLDTGKVRKRRGMAYYEEYEEWMAKQPGHQHWLLVGSESLSNGGAAGWAKKFTDRDYILLVDESSYFKNHKATRTKEVIELSEHAKHRIIMTGTPIGNRITDLFSQFEIVDPAIIACGNASSFRARYCILGGYDNKEIVGYQNVQELIEAIAPYTAQVKKKDVLKDLPDKLPPQVRQVQMTAQQAIMYKQMKKTMALEYMPPEQLGRPREMVVASVLEQMLRLHELAVGILTTEKIEPSKTKVRQFDKGWVSDSKLTELMNVLEEARGQSAVIWCTYRMEIEHVVQRIMAEYGPDSVVQLHGGIDLKERHRNVHELFQKRKVPYLVGTPTVGGMGLDMFAAHLCVYHSCSWDLILRMQSEDRLHRKGQKDAVSYLDIVAHGTIDHGIIEALYQKRSFADYISDAIAQGGNPFELV